MNKQMTSAIAQADSINVILIGKDGQSVETICSTEVAEMVEKEHKHLLRDIRTYIEALENEESPNLDPRSFFIESTYVDSQNKERPCYQVTRKGCEMIANKLIGQKGVVFTAKYIERFHEMQDYIKDNKFDISRYSKEMQAILMQDEKLQLVEKRVDSLEDNIHITRSQQRKLKDFANKVVISALGSKYSNAYKKFSNKAFSAFWHDYKNRFDVASYLDTPKLKFQEALQFINDWEPNDELKYLIVGANTYVQQEF